MFPFRTKQNRLECSHMCSLPDVCRGRTHTPNLSNIFFDEWVCFGLHSLTNHLLNKAGTHEGFHISFSSRRYLIPTPFFKPHPFLFFLSFLFLCVCFGQQCCCVEMLSCPTTALCFTICGSCAHTHECVTVVLVGVEYFCITKIHHRWKLWKTSGFRQLNSWTESNKCVNARPPTCNSSPFFVQYCNILQM